VYGPRQVGDGAIRGMILQALQHAPITLYNDGTQIRAWCYVDDFVDGVLRCAEMPEAIGHAFNLGNPQGTITNFELANMIIRLTTSKSDIVYKPHPGPEVDLRVPSIEKATTMLGYQPKVALETGMRLVLTGASGFIGRNVLLRAPRDWEVIAVYHRTADLEAFVKEHTLPHVRPVACDLTDETAARRLGQLAGRADAALYLAANSDPAASAERPRWDLESNTVGLVNFLGCCALDRRAYV